MKIGVNLLFLVPGDVGGSEPLLTNLVQAIAKQDGTDVTVYALKGFSAAYPVIASLTEVVEVAWDSGAQLKRILTESSWLASDARRRRLDVLHHGVGTTPLIKTVPSVVTIHDVQYRHRPENFSLQKRIWLRANVPFSLRTCRAVTTPSNWVKDDLGRQFQTDLSKIVVVPFGSANLFGDMLASGQSVKQKYGLTKPYFFFPGRSYLHKNHNFLLEAFAPLADRLDLIFCGPSWPRDQAVLSYAKELSIGESVRHLGRVSRDDLAGLYEAAEALAYPTLFEGFGAPILEAMTQGCPVLASDITAIPEIVSDAGWLLKPNATKDWTDALLRVHEDRQARDGLIERGYARASTFTWEAAAQAQLDAYRIAVNS